MHLKELHLFGFKSFPNKTTIKFSKGITAIIGPNGCGKTNILDALRWVLGEQSFSILRCNKNEELIFAGTKDYPALGYTEVKLILENDGDLPNFGSEIEIKRRYFRSGESEFYLNRNPCRLKDIQDIFFNSGSKAYSIFDLPRMREIITGGAKRMFEEAANLARYRERKQETLSKLTLTESELLRLNDVIAERERYTRSLARQARRLALYERLKDEERRLKLVYLKTQYLTLQEREKEAVAILDEVAKKEAMMVQEIAETETELAKVRQHLREARSLKETLTSELEANRTELQEKEKAIIAKRERISFLQQKQQALQKDIKNETEKVEKGKANRANLAKALEEKTKIQVAIQRDLESIRTMIKQEEEILFNEQVNFEKAKTDFQSINNQIVDLHQKLTTATARQQNLLETQTKLKGEIENLTKRLTTLQNSVVQTEEKIGELDKELAQLKSVLAEKNMIKEKLVESLEQQKQEHQQSQEKLSLLKQEIELLKANLGQEINEVIKAKLAENFLGGVQEFIAVEDGYELACETALYAILDFLVVKKPIDPQDFKLKARLGFVLAENGFTPELDLAPHAHDEIWAETGVIGRLTNFVTIKPQAPQLLRKILNEFVLVENINYAWRLQKRYPQFSFVTKDGIALFGSGILVKESAQGRLTIEKYLKQKETDRLELEEKLTVLTNQIQMQTAAVIQLNQELEQIQNKIVDLLAQRLNRQTALSLEQRSKDEVEKELTWLSNDLTQTEERLKEIEHQLANLSNELNEKTTLAQQLKDSVSNLEKVILAKQALIKEKLEEASKVLFNLGKTGEELTALKTAFDYQTKDLELAEQKLLEYCQTEKDIELELQTLVDQIRTTEQEIARSYSTIMQTQKQIEALNITEKTKEEERIEALLKEKRETLEKIRQTLMEQRMAHLEIQKQREALEREAKELFGIDIATIEVISDEQVSSRLKIISERLMNLGRVNPLAKEEFTNEKAELDKYLAQREDVLRAQANLQSTISEIENYAKDQFLVTFHSVREHFRSIFNRLFVEGEADLILTNEANPLDSEIEIIARPKGKVPKRLEHLSDGEKALLALSLLFAFYSVKPAPFCFFDEVDAPLDDANVVRFADFLREMAQAGTQAVVITHNRLTIEKADVLLGVTTEEPGISKVISVRLADFRPEPQKSGIAT